MRQGSRPPCEGASGEISLGKRVLGVHPWACATAIEEIEACLWSLCPFERAFAIWRAAEAGGWIAPSEYYHRVVGASCPMVSIQWADTR
jgi:hypothetical protein